MEQKHREMTDDDGDVGALNSTQTVLLVDDDPGLVRLLAMRVEDAGYHVLTATSGEEAQDIISISRPDVVVTDVRMGGMDGLELFRRCQKLNSSLPFIIITAHGSISDAVEATQSGAFSFIPKPLDTKILLETIAQAVQTCSPWNLQPEDEWVGKQIVTCNPRMIGLVKQAKKIAVSDLPVLILGASGTGKEVFARLIHESSRRRDRPFVSLNCASMPDLRLESELHGYKKGVYAGAEKDYQGIIQAADGGTLFLDEIGDMSLTLQTKLVQILQESKVRAVGSNQDVPVNVRIISATNIDVDLAVQEKSFREDLFYRINAMSIELPSLVDRREDIPLLANHFLVAAAQQQGVSQRTLSPKALEYMKRLCWKGNIRHLKNVVEQLSALSPARIISSSLVEQTVHEEEQTLQSFKEARDEFERNYLIDVLTAENGNVTRAASTSRRNRTDFYKLLSKHGISPGRFKRSSRLPS